MSNWTQRELHLLAQADELSVSPLRQDGVRHASPTVIWSVVVGDDVVVRAYRGTASRWYRTAVAQREGRIHVFGHTYNVMFEPLERDRDHEIDTAYREKYRGSPYLGGILHDGAQAAGLRIVARRSAIDGDTQ